MQSKIKEKMEARKQMNSDKLLIIVPIIIYLALMLYIAYHVNGIKNSSFDFAKEYFIGGRTMGGFVMQ